MDHGHEPDRPECLLEDNYDVDRGLDTEAG